MTSGFPFLRLANGWAEEKTERADLKCPVVNAMTVDVEDYFQAASFERTVPPTAWNELETRVVTNTRQVLDRLERAGVQATFFVLGWVADREPKLVREIRTAGHQIGCCGYGNVRCFDRKSAPFRADLRRACVAIQAAGGGWPSVYRASRFSLTSRSLWALDVLAEEGFRLDASIVPARHNRHGLPGSSAVPHPIERPAGALWEYPPSICRFLGRRLAIGGGCCLRYLPYWLTRRALGQINEAGRPFSICLRTWEIDPDQPRLRCKLLPYLRHYANLARTDRRLGRLLRDFRFATLTESLSAWRGLAEPRTDRRAA
jgi:polysaccharide deacetylase family protein (PEP-CTERM system associated)